MAHCKGLAVTSRLRWVEQHHGAPGLERLKAALGADHQALIIQDVASPHRAHCLSVLGWAAKSIELSGSKVTLAEETRCRTCGTVLISRRGFTVVANVLVDSRCPTCGTTLAGRFGS